MGTNKQESGVIKRHGRQLAVAWYNNLSLEDKHTFVVIFFGNKKSYKHLNEKEIHDLYKYNNGVD